MIVYRQKTKLKMRNQPVRIDGYYFQSKKESRRYLELYALQKLNEIDMLEVHPRFEIDIGGEHVTTYMADFSYWINSKFVVEDVKGRKAGPAYDMFKLKKKLMNIIKGLEVKEI